MANTINIPRSHLIMGLCLPLAVLLGYFLAEPMDSASLGVLVLVIAILSIPLLMKWHHPLLILSWNAVINPYFLPGSPGLWMIMGFISLLFALLSRSVNPDQRFIFIPSLVKPLLFMLAVVVITAMMTGGVGLRSFGGESYGGKGYFFIFASVIGFFALSSKRIPVERAGLYVGMFFLASLTPLIGIATEGLGPRLLTLQMLFAVDLQANMMTDIASFGSMIVHIGSLTYVSQGLYCFLLARYGFRGVFDFSKPWRPVLFVLATAAVLACGFRGSLFAFGLTLAFLFYFERLHRTAVLAVCLGLLFAGSLAVIPLAKKLPTTVQRTLSFLPLDIDPVIKQTATQSTDWRLEIWRTVLPQVPKYLVKGKGYALNPNDLYMTGFDKDTAEAILAGNYHNGPLTLIIPFGIAGVIGFCWFLIASLRYLHYNFRFGDPRLQRINTFLFATFIVSIISFILIFGSFYADLRIFVGLVGLSVSLNGEPQPRVAEEAVPEILEPAH